MESVNKQVDVREVGGTLFGRLMNAPDMDSLPHEYLAVVDDWKKRGRMHSGHGKMVTAVIGILLLIIVPVLILVFYSGITVMIGDALTGILLAISCVASWMSVDRIGKSNSINLLLAGEKTKRVVRVIKEMLDSPVAGEGNAILLEHKKSCIKIAIDNGKGIEQSNLSDNTIASSIIIEAYRDLAYGVSRYLPNVLRDAIIEVDKVQQTSKGSV